MNKYKLSIQDCWEDANSPQEAAQQLFDYLHTMDELIIQVIDNKTGKIEDIYITDD